MDGSQDKHVIRPENRVDLGQSPAPVKKPASRGPALVLALMGVVVAAIVIITIKSSGPKYVPIENTAVAPARNVENPSGQSPDPAEKPPVVSSDPGVNQLLNTRENNSPPIADANSSESRESQETAMLPAPGAECDIEKLVRRNKMTIFDFFSEYCGPCRRISPLLDQLAGRRSDIAVVKIDINRPGVRGIDWQSPVARQYNLHGIPFFIVYDESGSRKHEGDEAYQWIMQMLSQEGLI